MVDDSLIEAILAASSIESRLNVLEEADIDRSQGATELLDAAASRIYRRPADGGALASLARLLADELQAPEISARASYIEGMALSAAGEFDAALRTIDEARATFSDAGARSDALRTSVGRSGVLASAGRYLDGEAELLLLLDELDAEEDDSETELTQIRALAQQNLGTMLITRGRYRDGLGHLDAAGAVFAERGDLERASQVATNSTPALIAIGRATEAISSLRSLLDKADAEHHTSTRAIVAEELAGALSDAGELANAVPIVEEAVALYEATAMANDARRAQLRLGRILLQLNLLDDAEAIFSTEDAPADADPHPHHRALALEGLAAVRRAQGHPDEAEAAYREATAAYASIGFVTSGANCKLELAALATERGADDVVRELLSEIGPTSELDEQPPTIEFLLELLHVRVARTAAEAREHLDGAAAALDRAQLRPLQYLLDLGRSHVERRQGRYRQAVVYLEQAVHHIETTRNQLRIERHREAFLAGQLETYEMLFELLIGLGDETSIRRAFEVAEQVRSRLLLDAVSDVLSNADVDSETAEYIASLRQDLEALYSRLLEEEGPDRTTLLAAAPEVARQLETRLANALTSARPGGVLSVTPPGIDDVLDHAARHETTIVSYHAHVDRMYAFVGQDHQLDVVQLGVANRELQHLVRRLQSQIERIRFGSGFTSKWSSNLRVTTEQSAADLHRAIWAPIQHLVSSDPDRRVLVVPPSILHGVPFQALSDGGVALIEKHEITVAPSAATWLASDNYATSSQPAVISAGRVHSLIHTSREASLVAKWLSGFNCEVHAVNDISRLSTYRRPALLHLACHGYFRSDNPWFSALQLDSGSLTTMDVTGMDLRGSIVVLSACEGGRAAWTTYSEPVGLAEAFLVAGAAAVIASQWPVDDRSTADFMNAVYGRLAAGETVAASLRQAQLAVRATSSHHSHWAPFTITGSGHRRLRATRRPDKALPSGNGEAS